jgi:hypothetical protein
MQNFGCIFVVDRFFALEELADFNHFGVRVRTGECLF